MYNDAADKVMGCMGVGGKKNLATLYVSFLFSFFFFFLPFPMGHSVKTYKKGSTFIFSSMITLLVIRFIHFVSTCFFLNPHESLCLLA